MKGNSENRRGRFARSKHRRDFLLWAFRRANGEGRGLVKFVDIRPFADSEAAARKIVEIANGLEPYMDGRLLVERINGPFLYEHKGSPAEYGAGIQRAIEKGWLMMHESGTYLRFTQAGADLFA